MANQSTLQLVDIREVRDGIVILKNGTLRAILEVTAINFELRSDDEQASIIQAFQSFLNSLDFPLQIVIQSRKLNIEAYTTSVQSIVDTTENDLLKIQGTEYVNFIKEMAVLSNIMSKKFYVVIPFYQTVTESSSGMFGSVKGIFKSGPAPTVIPDEKFDSFKSQILQRAELVYDGLIAMGLKPRMYSTDELMTFFYTLYNPATHATADTTNAKAEMK